MILPTFGRTDYDPNEIAKDGPFRAPRKWLHVQKVLIGVTVYAVVNAILFGLMPYPFPWWFAFVVGPAIVFAVCVKEYIRPTDPATHTLGEHLTDWVCDGSLYSGGAVLYYVHLGLWTGAAIMAALLFALYRMFRNGARP